MNSPNDSTYLSFTYLFICARSLSHRDATSTRRDLSLVSREIAQLPRSSASTTTQVLARTKRYHATRNYSLITVSSFQRHFFETEKLREIARSLRQPWMIDRRRANIETFDPRCVLYQTQRDSSRPSIVSRSLFRTLRSLSSTPAIRSTERGFPLRGTSLPRSGVNFRDYPLFRKRVNYLENLLPSR